MAQNDFTLFNEFAVDIGTAGNLSTDTFNVAIINNATVPTAADVTPTLADYTEVTGAGYTANGIALTTTWTGSGAVSSFGSSTNPSWAQTVGGPTDCYYALLINMTTGKAIGFIDLGGPKSLVDLPITINWTGGVIFTNTNT